MFAPLVLIIVAAVLEVEPLTHGVVFNGASLIAVVLVAIAIILVIQRQKAAR